MKKQFYRPTDNLPFPKMLASPQDFSVQKHVYPILRFDVKERQRLRSHGFFLVGIYFSQVSKNLHRRNRDRKL